MINAALKIPTYIKNIGSVSLITMVFACNFSNSYNTIKTNKDRVKDKHNSSTSGRGSDEIIQDDISSHSESNATQIPDSEADSLVNDSGVCNPYKTTNKLRSSLHILTRNQLDNYVDKLPFSVEMSTANPLNKESDFQSVADLKLDPKTTDLLFEYFNELSSHFVQHVEANLSCFATASTIEEEKECIRPSLIDLFYGSNGSSQTMMNPQVMENYVLWRSETGKTESLQLTVTEYFMSMDFLFRYDIGDATEDQGVRRLSPTEVGTAIHWLIAQSPPSPEWIATFKNDSNWENPKILATMINELLLDPKNGVMSFIDSYFYLGTPPIAGLPETSPLPLEQLDATLKRRIANLVLKNDFTFKDLLVGEIEILKNPSMLARLTSKPLASPVARGHFIGGRLLCQEPPGVIVDFPFVDPANFPDLNPRELLETVHLQAGCKGCHNYMDPFGFTLDNFDVIGNPITQWPNGKPIDTSVEVNLAGLSINGKYNNIDQLSSAIADSEEFSQCVNLAMLSHLSGFKLELESRELQPASCKDKESTSKMDMSVAAVLARFFLSETFLFRFAIPPID